MIHTPTTHLAVTPPTFDAFNETANVQRGTALETAAQAQTNAPEEWDVRMPDITVFSTALSLALIIWSVYSIVRIMQIRSVEAQKIQNAPPSVASASVMPKRADAKADATAQQTRWESVQRHVASSNENDWRQAIIEADIMLEDLVNSLGYAGEGLGEKLKQVERADFNTIDMAWEAHKIRNRIAHDGSEHPLDQREAKRIVNLFRQVFEEHQYIAPQA